MDRASAAAPVTIALPAEIDVVNCASVAAGLAGAIESSLIVIADMTGTSFCDSAGVGVLLAAHQRAVSVGCELRLAVRPGGSVARVLGIVGLDRIVHIYVSVPDAMPAAPAVIELAELPAPAADGRYRA